AGPQLPLPPLALDPHRGLPAHLRGGGEGLPGGGRRVGGLPAAAGGDRPGEPCERLLDPASGGGFRRDVPLLPHPAGTAPRAVRRVRAEAEGRDRVPEVPRAARVRAVAPGGAVTRCSARAPSLLRSAGSALPLGSLGGRLFCAQRARVTVPSPADARLTGRGRGRE